MRRRCGLLLVAAACEFAREAPPVDPIDEPDATVVEPAPRCGEDYPIQFQDHGYRLTDAALAWRDAETECARDGGHLLKIESAGEDAEAARRILLDPPTVWIGLHDAIQNGIYVWSDGAEPTYRNYNGPPPGPTSPDCIEKSTNDLDGRWYTRDCTTPRRAVCECDGP